MDLHLPNRKAFTGPALKQWDALDPKMQAVLLNNAWCGHCRTTTHIQVRFARVVRGDLLLSGICGRCGGEVARVVEGG